jgi:hypothetical protein
MVGVAAAVALFSVPASAQFTGVVVAPPKPAPAVDSAPKTIAERRDSAVKVTMTNMKDWVDSAATSLGVPVAPVVIDSAATAAAVAPMPAHVDSAAHVARATTEFREGAPAPNTATPIPLLALLGLTSLVAGLWMMRRRA